MAKKAEMKVIEKAVDLGIAIQKHNSKQSMKHDSGKDPVELVPASFIREISKVLAHGAQKYERNNWTKGLPWTRILGSTLRHIYAWASKEDKDPESGLPHLAHAATNIMFLMTWSKTRKALDDRFDYTK